MNEDIIKILDGYDWEEVIIKMTAYVVNICRWRRYKLPGGLEEEDIVMTAIGKVYTYERKWDPEKEPDLLNYLQGVINSIISNELNAVAAGNIPLKELPAASDQTIEQWDEEMYCEQIDRQISGALKGEPGLCLVYKALKDGNKPIEIAREYSIPIEQIRLFQKKLRRLATKIITQLSKVC